MMTCFPSHRSATIHSTQLTEADLFHVEREEKLWDNPTMTVVADSKKRITLPDAKPGDAFDVQFATDGSVVLRKLVPAERRVEAVRKDGRVILRATAPISLVETLEAIEKYAL